MTIKPVLSLMRNPHLLEFVDKIHSGVIDPFQDHVVVLYHGPTFPTDLASLLPEDVFGQLDLRMLSTKPLDREIPRPCGSLVLVFLCEVHDIMLMSSLRSLRFLDLEKEWSGVSTFLYLPPPCEPSTIGSRSKPLGPVEAKEFLIGFNQPSACANTESAPS